MYPDQLSNVDAIAQFSNAMFADGLGCKEPLIADAGIHRFHVKGDRAGSKNGWYVLFNDVFFAGAYGSWKTGETHKWSLKGKRLSQKERERLNDEVVKARVEGARRRRIGHVDAANLAEAMWSDAMAARPDHPYLISKRVFPHNLRQIENRLLVPLYDFYGKLWNLQQIYANGDKFFLKNGRVTGMYAPVNRLHLIKPEELVVCEGWATGATVYEKICIGVLCAMNAGNLLSVSKSVREHYPHSHLIIAADNDRFTRGNPGVSKAREAAVKVNGLLKIPQFPESDSKGTDFNDLAKSDWSW